MLALFPTDVLKGRKSASDIHESRGDAVGGDLRALAAAHVRWPSDHHRSGTENPKQPEEPNIRTCAARDPVSKHPVAYASLRRSEKPLRHRDH